MPCILIIIHPSTPLISALSTFTALHAALLSHGVQFVLNYFSWGWGLPWSVVGLPRVASLNKGDSPRSYQMPTVPQVGVDFSPSPHPPSMLECGLAGTRAGLVLAVTTTESYYVQLTVGRGYDLDDTLVAPLQGWPSTLSYLLCFCRLN